MINGLRFIIGEGCNYECFFCHHEGYQKNSSNKYNLEQLKMIYEFANNNGVYDISITGGEPFAYWEKLKQLLFLFGNEKFKITLNSNLVLADKYIDILKEISNIEYHVNFSSLNETTHKSIIHKEFLKKLKNNLELFRSNGLKVCLNIPVLNTINSDELIDIFDYSKQMDFIPRFLVLLPMSEDHKKYFLDVEDIMKKIPDSNLVKKYSYGRYDIQSPLGNYEIVKCLCIDHECELCKKNTYIHLTPELKMRLCMESNVEYDIDYTSDSTVYESFEKASKRLKK